MRPLEPVPAIVESQYSEFVALDQRVDAAEGEGLRARWEFGQALVREKTNVAELARSLGDPKKESEFYNRRRFAVQFPSEDEFLYALKEHGSWWQILSKALAKPKTTATPSMPTRPYSVIYADPPWRYDFSETDSRQIENQYPTMTVEEIAALDVPAGDGSVLYLWGTAPKLREALQVMDAWGFEYVTNAVWVKDRIGMGYWFRGRHELLLVGKRGTVSPPTPEQRPDSVIEAPRAEHSRKPDSVYSILEQLYPDVPKIELFSRRARPGWDCWGNEAAA